MAPGRPFAAVLAVALGCLIAACTSSSTSTTAPSGDKCSISANTSPSSFGASGGPGSVSIQTSRDCTWSVAADASWVSIAGPRSGQGEAVVPYTVAPNPAPAPRAASLTVGAERLPVSQAAAACAFNLSSSGDTIGAAGGRLSVAVTTLSGCAWSAASNAGWLTITAGQGGTASGTVAVSVARNGGPARTGSLTIARQTYTVTQAAAESGPPPPPQITINGIVLTLFGKCPGLTFTVGGNVVTTDRNTKYTGGKCGDVKIGRTVTVTGTRGSDDVISADFVQFNQ